MPVPPGQLALGCGARVPPVLDSEHTKVIRIYPFFLVLAAHAYQLLYPLSYRALALMMMMMWSLMSSDVGLTYKGQTVTNACAWFNVALRPQKPQGSLGRGAQDGHLDFHTAPELCCNAAAYLSGLQRPLQWRSLDIRR